MMTNEHIWAWLQTRGEIFRVVSDIEIGFVKVYDGSGNIIMERNNLSKKQIEVLEENFLSVVAKRLNEVPKEPFYDPMIV